MVNLNSDKRIWDGLKAKDWTLEAKNILKGELKRRGVTYSQLCDLLGKMGISETEANIKNKISRGGFSFSFFLQCMGAIGSTHISFGPDYYVNVPHELLDLEF
ncbi:DUF6471 domain-containing protein [Mesorhizobium sp.]|uniref:DUF6471 domain-containing protein n=1 Tax=Mesorhizobium sp. TaxID=1871066 RepID=UPI00257C4914|nr:DUF6471 domain-containing protein [Mesorhizobium sp.]